jgi:adenosylcobinamide-GDP ribazoletransferase
MISLLAAFQFLTILPPIIRREFTADELGRSVGWYPLVGLALGGVLLGASMLFRWLFPDMLLVSAIIVSLWVLLTRALHLDGFMDACDGLFGGFTSERRLEIMRDSRVGAFGVAGGVLLLIIKVVALNSALSQSSPITLFIAPMIGRWGMTLAIAGFPYAREQGLGRTIKDHAGWLQILLATLVAVVTAFLASRWFGVMALALLAIIMWLGTRFILARIPGLTGDIYGALCEITELGVLLLFASRLVTLSPF